MSAPLEKHTQICRCPYLLVACLTFILIAAVVIVGGYLTRVSVLCFRIELYGNELDVTLHFLNGTRSDVMLVSLTRMTDLGMQQQSYDLHNMTVQPGDSLTVEDGLTARNTEGLPTIMVLVYQLERQGTRDFKFRVLHDEVVTVWSHSK